MQLPLFVDATGNTLCKSLAALAVDTGDHAANPAITVV